MRKRDTPTSTMGGGGGSGLARGVVAVAAKAAAARSEAISGEAGGPPLARAAAKALADLDPLAPAWPSGESSTTTSASSHPWLPSFDFSS